MRIVLILADDDLFIQAEWLSIYGEHHKRVTEDAPEEVQDAARTLAEWANALEPELRANMENLTELAEVRRDIARLQGREAVLLGR